MLTNKRPQCNRTAREWGTQSNKIEFRLIILSLIGERRNLIDRSYLISLSDGNETESICRSSRVADIMWSAGSVG